MHVLVICKNEEDPIKMKALEWPQHFPHYMYIVIFKTLARIWPNFELIPDLIVDLVTYKNDKDPIKNEDARMFTLIFK